LLATGDGGVDGDGSGGGAPKLVVVFDFVLFDAEFFGLTRDVFGAVGLATMAPFASAGTVPLAAAPFCGTMCVPARRRFRKLVEKTRLPTSAGVVVVAGAPASTGEGGGACELAPAAGGVNSRLMSAISGDDRTEDGDGAQIGSGGSWQAVKVPPLAN
jgi:hypothetical protein